MSTLNSILLQAGAGGGLSSMLMIVAMIAIFYFVMIRPQSKKQKELKRQREAMQKGDRVVTAGGIHGRIRNIKQNTIMVEVAPGMELEFDKASIYPAGEPAQEKEDLRSNTPGMAPGGAPRIWTQRSETSETSGSASGHRRASTTS